jgi:hypothetical protein
MPVFDEESAGENPFAAARARTVVRAGFGAAMLVAAVGFAAFYRGGGGLLFGGGHTFDLTVAVAGYMAALLFLFGFYGLLSEWARGGRGEPFRFPSIRGRGLVVLALALAVLVLLLPTFLPFVRSRTTSAGFAGLATLVVAPLVAVPIVIAADAAFARLVGL